MIRSYEDFPEKCLKCHITGEKLYKFNYSKRRLISSTKTYMGWKDDYETYRISFPVCETCHDEFSLYIKGQKRIDLIKNFSCFIILICTFAVFLLSSDYRSLIANIAITIILISIVLIILTVFQNIKIAPYKISKFIDINTKTGVITVKDPNYQIETDQKVQQNIILEQKGPQPGESIKCPKCGSLQFLGADFCRDCGKNLK